MILIMEANSARICLILVLLALALTATAQNPPTQISSFKPTADHPVLFDVFLKLAGSLESLHAQKRGGASSLQAQQIDRDFARVFRISPSELSQMFQIVRKATVEIKTIEEEMIKHANDRARWELASDWNTIRALRERRDAAIQANIAVLRTTLTSTGWTAVSNFINTDLRNSTVIARPAGAKP